VNYNELSIPIKTGWNLIGGLNGIIPVTAVQTNPPNILNSPFYEYNSGYQISNQIVKGKGYWVKSNSDGELILSISGLKLSNNQLKFSFDEYATLEITDNQLPPVPPSNIFDVRFDDETNVMFKSEKKLVRIQGNFSNIKLKFKSKESVDVLKINFLDGNEYLLENGREISIDSKYAKEFFIEVLEKTTNRQEERKNIFVSEVFPNPFNSSTKIRFYIPQKSENHNQFFAEIKIYDLLGRLINHNSRVVNSGYNEFHIEFNEHNLSSGLYFCEVIIQDLTKNAIHRELKKLNYIK